MGEGGEFLLRRVAEFGECASRSARLEVRTLFSRWLSVDPMTLGGRLERRDQKKGGQMVEQSKSGRLRRWMSGCSSFGAC